MSQSGSRHHNMNGDPLAAQENPHSLRLDHVPYARVTSRVRGAPHEVVAQAFTQDLQEVGLLLSVLALSRLETPTP